MPDHTPPHAEGSTHQPCMELSRDELVDRLYDELHGIAAGLMRHERTDHTLGPTALVNEAYLRLADQRNLQRASPETMRAAVARTMRRILIDWSRSKATDKRGGNWSRITLTGMADQNETIDVMALEEAIQQLEAHDERLGRVVELRFFGGLTVAQTARELGVSPETVARDWKLARAYLGRALAEDNPPGSGG